MDDSAVGGSNSSSVGGITSRISASGDGSIASAAARISNLRSIYRRTAAIRRWLAVAWLLELFGLIFVNIAGLLQCRDADSSLLFALHAPHFFTIVLTAAVVLKARELDRLFGVLFPIYLIAFSLDFLAVIGRVVLVVMAENSVQRRGELVSMLMISLFLVADALGAFFVEQLSNSIKRENAVLDAIASNGVKNTVVIDIDTPR